MEQTALVISIISAFITYISYRLNKRQIKISHTPILLPIIKKEVSFFRFQFFNNSKEDTVQNVNLEIKNGKLNKIFYLSDSFLAPNMYSRELLIDQDIDGS